MNTSKNTNDETIYCPYCAAELKPGASYCNSCGREIKFNPTVSNGNALPDSKYSKKTASLLCIFLGWIGVHRFYTKKKKKAWLMIASSLCIEILLICGRAMELYNFPFAHFSKTFYLFFIWPLFDLSCIMTNNFIEKNKRTQIIHLSGAFLCMVVFVFAAFGRCVFDPNSVSYDNYVSTRRINNYYFFGKLYKSKEYLSNEYVIDTYDEEGRVKKEIYYTAKGKKCLNDYGICMKEYFYDSWGNVIETRRYGLNGEPTLNSDGYFMIKSEYVGANCIKETYYDTNMKLVNRISGNFGIKTWEHEDYGQLIRVCWFDANGDRIMNAKYKEAIIEWTYYSDNITIKTQTSYNAKGYRCINSDGYSKIYYATDGTVYYYGIYDNLISVDTSNKTKPKKDKSSDEQYYGQDFFDD